MQEDKPFARVHILQIIPDMSFCEGDATLTCMANIKPRA